MLRFVARVVPEWRARLWPVAAPLESEQALPPKSAQDAAAIAAWRSGPVHCTDIDQVAEREAAFLQARLAPLPPASDPENRAAGRRPAPRAGFALSGGGIRSASFAIGVLQAFVAAKRLHPFDFLTSVSGGGYAATALTWMLSTWRGRPNVLGAAVGDAAPAFPLGGWVQGTTGLLRTRWPHDNALPLRGLDWIRRRAGYLTPGHVPGFERWGQISALSAGAVVLRGMVTGLGTYLPLLVAVMIVLALGTRAPVCGEAVAWFAQATGLAVHTLAGAWTAGWGLLATVGVAVFLAASLAHGVLSSRQRLGQQGYRLRIITQVGFGWGLEELGACLIMASLPWLFPLVFADVSDRIVASLSLTGLAGALGSIATFSRRASSGIAGRITPILAGAVLLYGLLVLGYSLTELVVGDANQAMRLAGPWTDLVERFLPQNGAALAIAFGLAAAGALVARHLHLNFVVIHRMYRDRLMETFMPVSPSHAPEGSIAVTLRNEPSSRIDAFRPGWRDLPDAAPLALMCGVDPTFRGSYEGPYHIICGHCVLTGSKDEYYRSRGGDSYIMSPLYCGSDATGWVKTSFESRPGFRSPNTMMAPLSLATAMAASAAAFTPRTGFSGERGAMRSMPISFLTTLLNLRLSFIDVNPARLSAVADPAASGPQRPDGLWPGLKLLLGAGLDETDGFIEISDGGHFENLAVYELIRRRLRLIVCSDGGADEGYKFDGLANLVERIRVDFGVKLTFLDEFPLHATVPPVNRGGETPFTGRLATRGFAIALIEYPREFRVGEPGNEPSPGFHQFGLFIYVKPTLIPGLPADLYTYKASNPAFPHQTTLDQFFDESQFESYRELGYRLAQRMIQEIAVAPPAPPGPGALPPGGTVRSQIAAVLDAVRFCDGDLDGPLREIRALARRSP